MNDIEVSQTVTKYSGEYKGISFEIQRFKAFEHQRTKYSWCHYIYLYDTQVTDRKLELPQEYFTAFGSKLNSDPVWVNDLEFHGGCTYCRIDGEDHHGRLLKIGCDYQHLWDEGIEYDIPMILIEVEKTIASLLKVFPDMVTRGYMVEEFRKKFPGSKAVRGQYRFDVEGYPLN